MKKENCALGVWNREALVSFSAYSADRKRYRVGDVLGACCTGVELLCRWMAQVVGTYGFARVMHGKWRMCVQVLMVEAAGVEPASGSVSAQASTCIVRHLGFAIRSRVGLAAPDR